MRAVEFDQAFTFAYSGSKLCSKVCVTTLYCVTFVKCVTLRFTVWLLHMVREWWCLPYLASDYVRVSALLDIIYTLL